MNQTQLAVLMADFADDDAAFEPDMAITFITEYLERMRLTMDQTDYEGMLYLGACIFRQQRSQGQ